MHLCLRWRLDGRLSDLMRTVKAGSSKWMRETFPELAAFAWQEGYSAFSAPAPSGSTRNTCSIERGGDAKFLRPSGAETNRNHVSTGSAALHPWLQSMAPPGPRQSASAFPMPVGKFSCSDFLIAEAPLA